MHAYPLVHLTKSSLTLHHKCSLFSLKSHHTKFSNIILKLMWSFWGNHFVRFLGHRTQWVRPTSSSNPITKGNLKMDAKFYFDHFVWSKAPTYKKLSGKSCFWKLAYIPPCTISDKNFENWVPYNFFSSAVFFVEFQLEIFKCVIKCVICLYI